MTASARGPWAPDLYEKLLSAGAVLMLLIACAAIARGHEQWAYIPPMIWLHLATILIALILSPVMLLRPRGDRRHRRLGYVWASAMLLTAIFSLFVKVTNNGRFSAIHILSIVVLIPVPRMVWAARRHNVRSHRISVKAITTSALLIAGGFTFLPGRLMADWLLG